MTIIFLVVACYLLLAVKKPAWALAVLLFLLPTYQIRLTLFNFPTTLLELLIVAFLIGFLALGPNLKALKQLGKINWAIGLFLLAAAIATIMSPEKLKALGELKAFFIEPVLLFYAAVILFSEIKNLKLALQSLFISSTLISLFGIVQYLTYLRLPLRFWGTGVEPERITSVFDYPNALALFLAPLFGLFAVLIYKRIKLFRQEWVEVLGLLLMAAALVLTFSRGAWLAVTIALALFFLKNHKGRVGLGILVVVMLGLLVITPIRSRITSALSDASSGAHWQLMKAGIDKVGQEPFLGNGLHGFRTTLQQAHFSGEVLNYPHNIFLNFWLETGLLGLLALALIISAAAERQKKPARTTDVVQSGGYPTVWGLGAGVFLLIVILHGLVDVPYFKNDLSILFWIIMSFFYLDLPLRGEDVAKRQEG